MSNRRQIRRYAMQLLYQMDMRGDQDLPLICEAVDQDASEPAGIREHALALARAAWSNREKADALASRLAPKWPAHRQPPVDRAILRLAYHELITAHCPVKVAINEAVEMAKRFSGESSPAFINGVLDHMAIAQQDQDQPTDDDQPRPGDQRIAEDSEPAEASPDSPVAQIPTSDPSSSLARLAVVLPDQPSNPDDAS